MIALAAVTLIATDATGTWTGTLTPSDGQARPAHLVLKQDGDKLTGTAGPSADDHRPIEKGKIENGTITFELPMGDSAMKFSLKQDGDDIAGDVTHERDGQSRTAKLAVKRAK